MRSLQAGLEEVRDALSRETRRGVIVLGTVVGALWLCVAGGVSAATREAPLSESVIAFQRPIPLEVEHVVAGPIEWPTIAIAPRPDPFAKKHKLKKR